jgi:hypothetical protein
MISTEQGIDDIDDVAEDLCEDTSFGRIVVELELNEFDIAPEAEKVGPIAAGEVLELSMFEGG